MQVVYNSLMNAYANCQMPSKAREVFDRIEAEGLQRDMVCNSPFCRFLRPVDTFILCKLWNVSVLAVIKKKLQWA